MTEYLDEEFLNNFDQSQARLATLDEKQKPDQAARAFQLQDMSGTPAEMIGSDPKEFDERFQSLMRRRLIQTNPYLAEFVRSHPLHAQLIKDDIPDLDEVTSNAEHIGTRQSASDRATAWATKQKETHLGWEDVPQAFLEGIWHTGQSLKRTGQVIAGMRGAQEVEQPKAAAPYELGDLTDLGSAFAKTTFRLAESSPALGLAGVAIGAGAATGNPFVGLGVGVLGGAGLGYIQTLGDSFQQELTKTPEDPDGAYNRAMVSSGISAAFGAAGMGTFGIKFLQGPVKNALFQVFAAQPALGAAHRGIEQARGNEQAFGEGYIEDVIGNALPALLFAGARSTAYGLRRGGPIRPYGEGSMEIIPPEGPPGRGPVAGRLERPAEEGLVIPEEGPTDMSRRSFLRGTTALAARAALPKLPSLPEVNPFEGVSLLPVKPWEVFHDIHPLAWDIAEDGLIGPEDRPYPGSVQTTIDVTKHMAEYYKGRTLEPWSWWAQHGLSIEDLVQAHQDAAKLMEAGYGYEQALARMKLAREVAFQHGGTRSNLTPRTIEYPEPEDIGSQSQQAQENKKVLDEAVKSAEKPSIRQSAPNKLQELLDQLPSQNLRIRSEAIAKLYSKLVKEPNEFIQQMLRRFEALNGAPGNVYVGSNRYLANIPNDVHKELSDHIAIGDDWTPSETKELEELKQEPQEGIYGPGIRVGGNVYEGEVHEEAYDRAIAAGETAEHEEGYVTTLGRFVDPVEALELARAQGQLRENPLSTEALLPDDLRPINFKQQSVRIGQEIENRLMLQFGSDYRFAKVLGKIWAAYYYRRSVDTGMSPEVLFDEDNVDIRYGMEGDTSGSLKQGPFAEGKNMLTASLDKMMKRSFGGNEWVQVPETGEEGQGWYWRYSPGLADRGPDRPARSSSITIADVIFQHKGTGAFTAYLEHVEDLAKQRGIGEIHLENIMNERLIPFYERRGYQKKTSLMDRMQPFPSMVKKFPQGRVMKQEEEPPGIIDSLRQMLRDLLGHRPGLSVIEGGQGEVFKNFENLIKEAVQNGLLARSTDLYDDLRGAVNESAIRQVQTLMQYMRPRGEQLYGKDVSDVILKQMSWDAVMDGRIPEGVSPLAQQIIDSIAGFRQLLDQMDQIINTALTAQPPAPEPPRPLTAKERGERLGIRLLEQTPRGRIGINEYGSIIELFSKARVDTLMHEFFHLMGVNVFKDALRPGANYKSVFMRTALLQFVGREPTVRDWQQLSPEEHERIADAGVMYIREGKAPSTNLVSVFEAYSRQLQGLYKDSSALGAPITNAMREFFSKLLATNEEIKRVTEPDAHQLEIFRRTVHIGAAELPDYPYQFGQQLQDLIDNPSTQWNQYVDHPMVREFLQRRIEPKHTADSVEHALEDSYFRDRVYFIDGKEHWGQDAIAPLLRKTAELAGGSQAIRQEYTFTVIIGPPGAGKSSITEGLAQELGARVIDTDDMRTVIHEYQGGSGIFATAAEASALMIRVMNAALARGDNIVHSFVGSNPFTAVENIMARTGEGYKLNVVHVHVDANTAVRRVMKRFVRTGRVVEPDYVAKAAENTPTTYERLKPHASQAAAIDNSGPLPVLIDGADTELGAIIGRTARGVGDTSLHPVGPSAPAAPTEGEAQRPAGGAQEGVRTFEQPESPFQQARAMGRTERELRRYLDLIAKQDAEDVEFRRALAQKLAERTNKEEWKARKKALEPAVRQEVEGRPEVAAWKDMQDDKFRIRSDAVDPVVKAKLPPKWFNNTTGLHPDDLANYFGYTTGEEWLQVMTMMVEAAKGYTGNIVDRLVKHELHQRLTEELGPTQQERLDEVMDHALSVTQMELLYEKTLRAGLDVGSQLPLSKAEFDVGIEKGFNRDPIHRLTDQRYIREAITAGRALEKAALDNDALKMFQWAQAQYIALQKAKLARKVMRQLAQFKKYVKAFGVWRPTGKISAEYVNWIHDMFLRMGIPMPWNEADLRREINEHKSKSLNDFVMEKTAAGYSLFVPDFLLDAGWRGGAPYDTIGRFDDMTVGNAKDTMDAIRSFVVAGRKESFVNIQGERLDKEATLDELIGEIESNPRVTRYPGASIKGFARTALASVITVESMANRWAHGAVWTKMGQLFRTIIEAGNEEAAMGKKVGDLYRKLPGSLSVRQLYKTIPNDLFKDPHEAYKPYGGPNGTFDWANTTAYLPMTRGNLRSILLQAGEPDHLERFATGAGVKPEDVMNWLFRYAKKEDWDWAQAHGDLFELLKTQSEHMERRISGLASERVPIYPINTPHGVYRGWYSPVIHDPSFYGTYLAKAGSVEGLFGSTYTRAGTPKGYTKERTNYRGPLDITLDLIPHRLRLEIHDIVYREAVLETAKILYSPRFQQAVREHYGEEMADQLIPWLEDIANGASRDQMGSASFSAWAGFLRQNMMQVLIGLNPRTLEKHTFSAGVNSVQQVGGMDFVRAFATMYGGRRKIGQSNWKFAKSKSLELQRRHQHFLENISGQVESAIGFPKSPVSVVLSKVPGGRTIGPALDNFRSNMLWAQTLPIAYFDMMSSVPTWLAAYRQIMEGRNKEYNEFRAKKMAAIPGTNMSAQDILDNNLVQPREGDAIYFADRAVRLAHGSTSRTNRPAVMRGQNPILQWFTTFYSFANRMANKQYEIMWRAKVMAGYSNSQEAIDAVRKGGFSKIFWMLFATVIAIAIIEQLASPRKDRDKEPAWERYGADIIEGLAFAWPGARDMAKSIMEGRDMSLGLGATEFQPYVQLFQDLSYKGHDPAHAGKVVKHANNVIGSLTGYSSNEIGNILEHLYDLKMGETSHENWGDVYRGYTKGQSKQKEDRPDMIEDILRAFGKDEPYKVRRSR